MAPPVAFAEAIEAATGARPRTRRRLAGGCVGEVYGVELDDGRRVAAKLGASFGPESGLKSGSESGPESGAPAGGLALEGWMLTYLAARSRLPVPAVLHASESLLVMEYLEGGGGLDAAAQAHAGELLADLHGVTAATFGLERDTVIGGLPQPNRPSDSWVDFFRDRRLLQMARQALEAGRLPAAVMGRITAFAGALGRWIEAPAAPALIHGDMWGGNILAKGGRITGFVDPAIYYADPEIELAFATMFGTFGEAFFRRYGEIRPLRPGFFEARRDIYNLYPLLVHVRLFGGGYLDGVTRTLARFGF